LNFEQKADSMKTTYAVILISVTLILGAGCSSVPKRPPEVFTNRNAANGQLDLGNQAVNKGDYVNAHIFMKEAWRLAASTDDPETRIRVLLADGNVWFNEGNREKADSFWAQAQKEAEEAQSKSLTAICKIYRARGTLPEGNTATTLSPEQRRAIAQNVEKITNAEMDAVKNNPQYAAFAWKVAGLANKDMGDWVKAEASIRKAAELHEKGRYLEDAAYDWYLIASVRSKAGNNPAALSALDTAISFDRCAENSNGLGMDWLAVGTIEEKAGNTDRAAEAYQRSAEIFRAAFLAQNADQAQKKFDALKTGDTAKPATP
jgi:tetratricopeptide (TPR) repeat protein